MFVNVFTVAGNRAKKKLVVNDKYVTILIEYYIVLLWNNCVSTNLACYDITVDELLQRIALPYDTLFDKTRDKSYLMLD